MARNVLHIGCADNVKFDVNEDAWPNADLAIHSSYEGALIDGLPADKVKAGNEAAERSAAVLLGQGDRHSSRQIDPAHGLGSTNEGERSEIAMCTEGFRDDSEG